ncbi:uncharacterized protein PAC_20122 [Phialocephala subalpina]|uniref:Zn(2)-C6 fungal-type domain-containing protein n=1 Tax=Phialocephala subalpina TaxID=576137 RepID=A0A1L7XYS7_9HELO|nr:uncharacterized protein PAC_20122 [Phialocephala subalpina]
MSRMLTVPKTKIHLQWRCRSLLSCTLQPILTTISTPITEHDPYIPPAKVLQFITQTGGQTTDPILKKKVRQHARNYVSRSRGVEKATPLLQFRLVVPKSFNSSSSGGSTPNFSGSDTNYSEIPRSFGDETEELDSISSAFSSSVLDGMHRQGEGSFLVVQSQLSTGTNSPTSRLSGSDLEQLNRSRGNTRNRALKAKVRTGCDVCKARHTKCDETKPACLRCLRTSENCSYPLDRRRAESSTSTRALAPKSVTSQTTFRQPSVMLPFEDDTEALYFTIFREETAIELSGVFTSSFWNHLLLQESYHQPFVRQALIAIAALNESVKTSQLSKTWSRKQREYALSLYGKSLQGMQLITQGSQFHLRELAIAVLLVFVFETIHRQPDIAFSHALIGDRLLCHFVKTTPHLIPHNEGIASPASHVIEHELLMTFCRFDTEMMTFVDARSWDIHDRGKRTCLSTVEQMPAAFTNMREATLYWQVVMRRSGHFLLSTSGINGASKLTREFDDPFEGKTLEINAQTSIYGSPFVVPDSLVLDQQQHSSEIEHWSCAFKPLSTRLQHGLTDIKTTTANLLLRLYSLTLGIVVKGTTFTEETSYDTFLPLFREIITLSRTISTNLLAITNQQPAFHFHLSIISPLFTLLLRCRDRSLRREAIEILRMKQFDGPWDRYMVAAVGKWIMDLEEAGEVEGFVPEEKRVRLSRMVMSMERRSVLMQAVRRDAEGGLEWVETKLDGPWL